MKKSSLFLIAGVLAMTVAVSAQAATPVATAAAPAAAPMTPPPPPTFGAPIAGECVLDMQGAIMQSAMGKAGIQRLTQLNAAVQAELSPEQDALETTYNQLVAQKKAATTPAQQKALQTAAQGFYEKRDALQAKGQQRQQEMQATQQKMMQTIGMKLIPQINAVVTQRGCSTVVSADAMVRYGTGQDTSFTYVNPAMDITSAVVQKLDATGEVLPPFDREHMPDQGAQGGQ